MFIIFDELYEFIDFLFACIPGRTGRLLRMLYFSILFRKLVTANIGQNVRIRGIKGIVLGDRVMIGDNCFITAKSSGSIVIGDNVSLNMSCHVNADVNGSIILGNDSIYGPSCLFRASNHQFGPRVSPKYLSHDHGSIVIGEGVWSGAYVVFLKGHQSPLTP